jgi:hypothetical protein
MSSSADNVTISPVNVLWRIEASEQIDYTGITAASLSNAYWIMRSAKDATLYHVWHNLDAGGVDPAPVGSSPLEVAITTGDSATTIATAVAAIIDGDGNFTSTSSAGVVSVNRTAVGLVTDTADFDAGVAITICRRGKDFDLGLLDGDIEFSVAPSNFIVTAHQTGVTPKAALFQGLESLEAGTVMLETQTSQLDEIYSLYGDTFTPSAGTEVTGIGTSTQGENLLINSARLVLKPVNAVDDSANVSMMLSIPVPESLTFSGENPRTLSVTWQGFVDEQIDARASAVVIGDETQAGLRI